MKFPRNAKIFRGQLTVAPFAGMLFLLLIFLLLNSALVFTPGVPIQLPEAFDLSGISTPRVAVAVDQNGQLYYESQVIKEQDLKNRLKAAVRKSPEPLTLVVEADKTVSYEMIIRLATLAREAGFKEAWSATRPKIFPGPSTNRPSLK